MLEGGAVRVKLSTKEWMGVDEGGREKKEKKEKKEKIVVRGR